MSYLIEPCAGHVHIFNGAGQSGVGMYKVSPEIPSTGGGRCLVMGIPLRHQEIVQPSITLDDQRTLYVFGSTWSEASIAGLLLLGENSGAAGQLGSLVNWYETNRVSKLNAPVSLSLGGEGVEAYVVGLELGQTDAVFNKQMFTISLLIAKD